MNAESRKQHEERRGTHLTWSEVRPYPNEIYTGADERADAAEHWRAENAAEYMGAEIELEGEAV